MKISGAEIIARTLKAHGVDVLCTLVGDHTLPLCDRLPDHGIRIVDTRQDAAAVHLADGMARTRAQVAVCATTGGPGLCNAVAGLATAMTAEAPIVHIAGAPELGTEGMGGAQELDQVGLVQSVTKQAKMIRDPRRLSAAIAEAFRVARSGRPGPVHLTIPLDPQNALVDEAEAPIHGPGRDAVAQAGAAEIARALDVLQSAARPILLAGSSLRYGVDSDALRRFVDRTGAPFFAQETARGLLPDSHPLSMGYPDGMLNEAGKLVGKADVVVLIGKKTDYRVGFALPPFVGEGARLIQVDAVAGEIGRHRAVEVGMLGHPGTVVAQLAAEADGRGWPDWSEWTNELRGARDLHRHRIQAQADREGGTPIHPLRTLLALRDAAGEEAAYVFDVGDFGLWGRLSMPAHRSGRWHRPGSLAQLGSGLPIALGVKLALPDAPVACVIGDGGLGYHLMEMDTAVRHDIPIVVVVGNDAGWGVDRHFQIAYYGRAVATDLRPLRYDRLAAELGCHTEHVEHADDLLGAMRRAFASGRPALVNVNTLSVPSPAAQAIIARHHEVRAAAAGRG